MKIELVLLVCIIFCSLTQVLGKTNSSLCHLQTTCRDCIRTHRLCAWCLQEDFDYDGSTRCDHVAKIGRKCSDYSTYRPMGSRKTMRNLDLTEKGGHLEKVVQLAPQEVEMRLRPHSSLSLTMDFIQAVEYPVDIYILVDLSNSMRGHQQKIAEFSESLTSELRNTSNARIGFGSFVGKSHDKIQQPCRDCAVPYGFLNHLTLGKMFRNFEQEVLTARFSENLDDADRGFDAIMQAITCKEDIGWRHRAQKILVFFSDKVPRYAGDGKDGPSAVPNDGYCHLDHRGFHHESAAQEYPSIHQIQQAIERNRLNIIFAVPENQVSAYESLKENFQGSSVVNLESSASNLVDLIRTLYDGITSDVEMRDNAGSNLQVTYFSKCIGGQREENTNICTGLKAWSKVTFTAKIELLSCPRKSEDWNQTIAIYPVGVPDAVHVRIEMICDCQCEKSKEIRSPKCSGSGDYMCGACMCDSMRYGRSCECERYSYSEDEKRDCNIEFVKPTCSGRGTCVCGVCDCMKRQNPEEKIYGTYCERDNFSCDRFDGQVCGGPERGTCADGYCFCHPDWTGAHCGCLKSNAPCVSPHNAKICSGNGDCVCGVCKCNDFPDGRYSGTFCEKCPTCPTKCEEYKNCVQCQVFPNDSSVPSEECHSCPFISVAVNKVKVNESEQLCTFKDNTGCKFTFKYVEHSYGPVVFVEKTKECPKPWSAITIVLGSMAGVFLVALLLLFLV